MSFDLAPGFALSDAVSGIRAASDQIEIPDAIQGNFQGTAAAFQDSTKNMGMLLVIAMVVVYIILGILYESFIHPLTILSGLPSAAVGALITLYIAHLLFLAGITPSDMSLTLYAFVGMIMLIGIVKKNAIMMIDFALHRQRNDGIAAEQAIFEAAQVRFPPHHDDHHGGPDGHPAHRVRQRHRRGIPPPLGAVRGGRAAAVPASDALHHAGDLFLSRPDGHAAVAQEGQAPRAAHPAPAE